MTTRFSTEMGRSIIEGLKENYEEVIHQSLNCIDELYIGYSENDRFAIVHLYTDEAELFEIDIDDNKKVIEIIKEFFNGKDRLSEYLNYFISFCKENS